jgi:hypothetical protein
MNNDDITLTTLTARLERAIKCDVGEKGLRTLLYGWRMKYQLIEDHTISSRRAERNGEPYLTYEEAYHFSQYCGYDLTRD